MEFIKIKPLSVNRAWQGKRFKTPEYKKYERNTLLMLRRINIPTPPFKVSYEFGFSSVLSDIDNPVKLITDILQKKHGFNDRDIYELSVKKKIVNKGEEYIKFKIESL